MVCSHLMINLLELVKYFAQNILWVLAGFGFGVAVYWWRVGQFINEFKSLYSLFRRKYKRGDEFNLKPGVDIKSLDGSEERTTTGEVAMIFGYERGVDWFFCSSKGLIRSRVIYAFRKGDQSEFPKYFAISHTYVKI